MKKMYSFRFDDKIISGARLQSEKIGISLSAYICLLIRRGLGSEKDTSDKKQLDKNINKNILQIAGSLHDISCVLEKISDKIGK
jgi:hypothetical protein